MNRREFTAGLVLVVGALLIGAVALLGSRTGVDPVPHGDQLGQEAGESFDDYAARAASTLDSAPADEPAFALVTFSRELTPEQASAVLEPVARVSAVAAAGASPEPVGEPAAGRDRTEIFRIAVGEKIVGAVVRDTGRALRFAAADERIAAVEVLPPDAVWGAFGMRPVDIQAE